MSIIKRLRRFFFFRIAVPILRAVCSLFFDKCYLRGRHFDESATGWRWAVRSILWQRILGFNRATRYPVSPLIGIDEPANIHFDVDDLNIFQSWGSYFSNSYGGQIVIGKGTWVAPNVGFITTNHKLLNPDQHDAPRDIYIGASCWIGMNAVILPGVNLGEHTIVGAGSVVTHSFPHGWCVLAGVPARLIRDLALREAAELVDNSTHLTAGGCPPADL